jgi:hypothetical protein
MGTPSILIDIVCELKTASLTGLTETEDGRIGSVFDEKAIIDFLQNTTKFSNKIVKPDKRKFYDMLVIDGANSYPINIKTTTGKIPDNAFNKLSFLYAFTDLSENELGNSVRDKKFISLITTRKKDLDRDYFYLCIDKNDNTNITIRGLKEINCWCPNANPSNILQIDWKKEHNLPDLTLPFDVVYTKLVINGVFKCYADRAEVWSAAIDIYNSENY